MTEERKHDFDSCSYDELTHCIKFRLKSIREIKCARKLLVDKYPNVCACLRLTELNLKYEIKELFKMRREMKIKNANHWRDTYYS